MTDMSPNIALPFLLPSQAAKHVTVNAAFARLDAVVQLAVESRTLAAQPAAPPDGARYVLPSNPAGPDWSGMAAGQVAWFHDGAWEAVSPAPGWMAYVKDEGRIWIREASGWERLGDIWVSKAGDAMTGALALPTNGLLVGSDQLSAFGGRIGIGTATPASGTLLHIARKQRDLLWIGPPYNGGQAMTDGDVRLTLAAWNGRAELFLTRHNVASASVAMSTGGALEFATSLTARIQISQSGAFLPASPGSVPLGSAGLPWSNIYAQNALTVTSDARSKTHIRPCPLGLDFINRLTPVAFRHKIGGVEETSAIHPGRAPRRRKRAGRRIHTGFLAQDVRAALPDGLDWAGWCLADPEDPDSAQALRYEDLIAPLVRAVQELAEHVGAGHAPLRARSGAGPSHGRSGG